MEVHPPRLEIPPEGELGRVIGAGVAIPADAPLAVPHEEEKEGGIPVDELDRCGHEIRVTLLFMEAAYAADHNRPGRDRKIASHLGLRDSDPQGQGSRHPRKAAYDLLGLRVLR